ALTVHGITRPDVQDLRLRLGVRRCYAAFGIVRSLLLDIIQPPQRHSNTRRFEVEDYATQIPSRRKGRGIRKLSNLVKMHAPVPMHAPELPNTNRQGWTRVLNRLQSRKVAESHGRVLKPDTQKGAH